MPFFTVSLRGRYMPIAAPPGAGAYTVLDPKEKDEQQNQNSDIADGDKVSLYFMMMQPKDHDAGGTLIRAREDLPAYKWRAIVPNPDLIPAPTQPPAKPFIAIGFMYGDGAWLPDDEALRKQMASATPMDVSSAVMPEHLGVDDIKTMDLEAQPMRK